MKKWPIYRYFSVFSQNSGNFGQNRVRVKKYHSLNENFRFLTSRSPNMILSPFALSSGLSVKIIISELKGGRDV